MSNPGGRKFRSFRKFLDHIGAEDDEPAYFCFTASLLIRGDGVPFDEVSRRLGVLPTRVRRIGERRGPGSPAYQDDLWVYEPPIAESEPLGRHLEVLWDVVRPHTDYLMGLKQRYCVEIFCGYRSNCDMCGFDVPHNSLEIFQRLELPFNVSVIIT